jgi:hypothetical protein
VSALLGLLLSVVAVLALHDAALAQDTSGRVHAVVDLGHEFTFYADGRFHKQYLPDQSVAMSWGSLFHFDFSNANLLVLLGCDPHLQYVPEDIRAITRDGQAVRHPRDRGLAQYRDETRPVPLVRRTRDRSGSGQVAYPAESLLRHGRACALVQIDR